MGKEANELATLSGLAPDDLVIVYDTSEPADEKLKNMPYANFRDAIATSISGGNFIHNNLESIQGGIVDEYYHLTLAEYTELQSGYVTDAEMTTISGDIVAQIPSLSGYATESYVDSEISTLSGIITSNDTFAGLEDTPAGYSVSEVLYYTASGVASSPNMTFVEGTGLDIADHIAIGNNATIDYGGAFPIILYVNESINASGGFYGSLLNFENTASGPTVDTVGMYLSAGSYTSTEHNNITGLILQAASSNNSGAVVDEIIALDSTATLTGDHSSVNVLVAGDFKATSVFNMNDTDIIDAIAGRFQVFPYGTGDVDIVNAYGVLIKNPAFSTTGSGLNLYGLYIEDQANSYFNTRYNIYSAGANSKNKFEGSIECETISGTTDITMGYLSAPASSNYIKIFDYPYMAFVVGGYGMVQVDDTGLTLGGKLDVSNDDIVMTGTGNMLNFGANTISGTGDIYCNDIYTASGTVYVGDLKLSSSGGDTLLINDVTLDDLIIAAVPSVDTIQDGDTLASVDDGSGKFKVDINGTEVMSLNSSANLYLGVNDSNQGRLQLYGGSSILGGSIFMYAGASETGVFQKYAMTVLNDQLQIQDDTRSAFMIHDAGTNDLEFHTNNLQVVSGGLELNSGATVDTIETTLTDDDTRLPTSGAVYDALGSIDGLSGSTMTFYQTDYGSTWTFTASYGDWNMTNTVDDYSISLFGHDSGSNKKTMAIFNVEDGVRLYHDGTVEGQTTSGAWKANNGLQIASSTIVNDIETTLTDDDTHLTTSGAVKDYVDTAISGVGGGGFENGDALLEVGVNDTTQGVVNVYGANDGTSGGIFRLYYAGSPGSAGADYYQLQNVSGYNLEIKTNTGKVVKLFQNSSGSTTENFYYSGVLRLQTHAYGLRATDNFNIYYDWLNYGIDNQNSAGDMGAEYIDTSGAIGTLYTRASDGNFDPSSNTSEAGVGDVVLCIQTGTANRRVLYRGWFRNDSWSFTPGQTLYVGTSGAIATSAPGSGNYKQIIGYAKSSTIIKFEPSSHYEQVP